VADAVFPLMRHVCVPELNVVENTDRWDPGRNTGGWPRTNGTAVNVFSMIGLTVRGGRRG
jgi:hypothetical protein